MAVKSIPTGYEAITPYLIVDNANAAIEFYKRAFGASEVMRIPTPDGCVGHAELKVGGGHVMLADEICEMGGKSAKTIGGSPVSLLLYVPDADATFKQALAAGAKEMRPMQNQFYGDRSGCVTDPYGLTWHISTHVEDVPPGEMHTRAAAAQKEFAEKAAKK
jgi:PhnB protein